MNMKAYESLVRSENAAKKYLVKMCRKNGHVFCPACGARKTYLLRDNRRRCSSCRYTFHDFTGRWLNNVKISSRQWIRIIKLFELEVSARKISRQTELSYPTALKAVETIRWAIFADNDVGHQMLLGGEIEMDESYFGGRRKGNRGRGAAGKVPVFGILERNGLVRVETVKDVSAKTLLEMAIKKVRRGSIVYTDKFKSYDSLMFCGYRHLRVDHSKYFSRGKVYINGLEGFWAFAKERMIKYHGVSKEKFPLYLKEMEFRYNNRKEPYLFDLIAEKVTFLVPNLL